MNERKEINKATNRAAHLVHTADIFGRLTVVEFSHLDKRHRRHYLVKCICGKEKTVQGTLLRSGNTKSCGCIKRESARSKALPFGNAARNQVYSGYRCKAKASNRDFKLTVAEFHMIAKYPCFYCGDSLTNIHRSEHGTGDYAYNGIDRIDSRKGYTISNSVSCCKICNIAKTNHSQGAFIKWIKKAYEHLATTSMAAQWGSS